MAAHEADYVDPTAELGKEWLDIEARRNCRWEHSFECACVRGGVGARASGCVCAWVRVAGAWVTPVKISTHKQPRLLNSVCPGWSPALIPA